MKFDVLIGRLHRQRAEVDFTAQAPMPRCLSFHIFDDARLLPLLSRGDLCANRSLGDLCGSLLDIGLGDRSEEHTSELQSLMRISYAVFCLKKKKRKKISMIDDMQTKNS